MKIVEFEGQTRLLGAPRGWRQGDVQCGFLPVQDIILEGKIPAIKSYWKPSEEEIKLLQAGMYLELTIIGINTAPIMLEVRDCKALP